MTALVLPLSLEDVAARLGAELPHWSAGPADIRRVYRTRSWKGTLMLVNSIGQLAEAADHHPDLEVSYAEVTVKLSTHSAGGITELDFELAGRIETLVMWRPAGAASAPPDDASDLPPWS